MVTASPPVSPRVVQRILMNQQTKVTWGTLLSRPSFAGPADGVANGIQVLRGNRNIGDKFTLAARFSVSKLLLWCFERGSIHGSTEQSWPVRTDTGARRAADAGLRRTLAAPVHGRASDSSSDARTASRMDRLCGRADFSWARRGCGRWRESCKRRPIEHSLSGGAVLVH